MTRLQKLVFWALFFDVILVVAGWSAIISADFTPHPILAKLLFWLPPLAFVWMLVGYWLRKPPRAHKVICRSGLGLFGLSFVLVVCGWQFMQGGVVESYADLQLSQVQSVKLYYDDRHIDEYSLLDEADAKRVVELVQRVAYCNPYDDLLSSDYLSRTRAEAVRFLVSLKNGSEIYIDARPARLVRDCRAYSMPDEQLYYQLLDLHTDLAAKYASGDDEAQLAAER